MKKSILLILMFVCGFTVCTLAQEIKIGNVGITIPNGWERKQAFEVGNSILSMYKKRVGVTVGLTMEENKYKNTQKTLKDFAVESWKAIAQNVVVIDESQDNNFTLKFTIPSGKEAYVLSYIVLNDNMIYKLTFTAPDEEVFKANRQEFSKIAGSLRIKKEDAVAPEATQAVQATEPTEQVQQAQEQAQQAQEDDTIINN